MSQPKVTIVGLGLIGSSMGLALRKAQPEFKVVGHDKDSSLARKAQELGAVEKWERNLISAIEDAELVIISTALADIRKVLESSGPYLRPDCVVTDTSTVKGEIMKWTDELLPETAHFVGGHPMVREDYEDAEDARADYFAGTTYCIVPSPKAHQPGHHARGGALLPRCGRARWPGSGRRSPAHDALRCPTYEHHAGAFLERSQTPTWRDLQESDPVPLRRSREQRGDQSGQ
jgi:prephenate dehydrogenase